MTTTKSVLDIEVSCFKNYEGVKPKPVNLLAWLTSDKYKSEVEAIRAMATKAERDAVKNKLPAITPSGVFSYRSKGNLIRHTGIICIDIDLKGNENVGNYDQIRELLATVPFIAYVGKSVSGTGFFAMVSTPVAKDEAEHTQIYTALESDFLKAGLLLDSTSDITRLRGYSYDPDAYFNHNPEQYTRKVIPEEKKKEAKQPKVVRSFTSRNGHTSDADKSVVEDFNDKADTIAMLRDAGYQILDGYKQYDQDKIYFLRPDATTENSGNYQISSKTLHVWSANTSDGFEVRKSYSPFLVFAQLYHNGDTKDAFNDLFEKGYGGEVYREKVQFNRNKNSAPQPDPNPYPYGVNPYTGEIFDERGYPSDWDSVQPPDEKTAEYWEMIRLIQSEFDAEIDYSFNPDESQETQQPIDQWRAQNVSKATVLESVDT
jgi:hypothetical protein